MMEPLQVVALGGGCVVLVSLGVSLLSGWWLANVITNFRQHLCVLGVAGLVLGTALGSAVLALVGAAVAVLNGAIVLAALRPAATMARPAGTGPALRVMSLNLLYKNRGAEAVLRQIDQVRPDVVLLQEVGPFWAKALAPLAVSYPHALQLPEARLYRHHAPVLLSRHPFLEIEQRTLGGLSVRFAAARLAVGGRSLWVASVHLNKPGAPAGFALQCEQLRRLAAWVDAREGPVVLGGDLNATSTAPQVRRLLAATGLVLDQQAVPSQAYASTYPAALAVLGLKIDHILIRGLAIRRAWTLPRVSSDHRGVAAEVVLSA